MVLTTHVEDEDSVVHKMARFKRSRFSKSRGRRFLSRFKRRHFRARVRRIVFGVAIPKYFEQIIDCTGTGQSFANTAGVAAGAPGTIAKGTFNGCSLINNLNQGFAQGQRAGDKIMIKYIQCAVYFNTQSGATPLAAKQDGMNCRYAIFQDKRASSQTVANKPIWDKKMWTTVGTSGYAAGLYPFAFKDYDNLSRFKTLIDAQHRVSLSTSDSANPATSGTGVIMHFIKVNRMTTFSKVGTDLSGDAVLDNDYVVQCISNVDGCCSMLMAVRVCFTDM